MCPKHPPSGIYVGKKVNAVCVELASTLRACSLKAEKIDFNILLKMVG